MQFGEKIASKMEPNWGLVGLFKFDLVAAVTGSKFGQVNPLSRVVYVLVLVAGVLAAASIPSIVD